MMLLSTDALRNAKDYDVSMLQAMRPSALSIVSKTKNRQLKKATAH